MCEICTNPDDYFVVEGAKLVNANPASCDPSLVRYLCPGSGRIWYGMPIPAHYPLTEW